jgi:hypothetical protein
MILLPQPQRESSQRQGYLRPLTVSIALSMTAEFFLFLVFGVFLFPAGPWLNKLLWTVVFCGIGMGATMGAFIDLLIVGRWQGRKAIVATMLLSIVILGIACDMLCPSLDRKFLYFGGAEDSVLFVATSVVMAAIGGLIGGGGVLFTKFGQQLLDRLGF